MNRKSLGGTRKIFLSGLGNPALRGDAKSGTDMQAVYKSKRLIESGLRKLPNFVGTVFRGAKMDQKWIENTKELCPSGRLVRGREDGEKHNCRFEINSLTGKNIEKYSVHPFNFEVLFALNTIFVIVEVVVFENGKLFVRMQEVE